MCFKNTYLGGSEYDLSIELDGECRTSRESPKVRSSELAS
jgi:hypothetical protein